uniref:LAETG motif-containing sortase-dependent surface protein n=1 Tax=Streptomyces lushanensis TaxID=1434255 RepID=UPI00316ADD5A
MLPWKRAFGPLTALLLAVTFLATPADTDTADTAAEAYGDTNSPETKAVGAADEQSPAERPATEQPVTGQQNLAETGGSGATPYLAIGGTTVLAIGAALLFATARRR